MRILDPQEHPVIQVSVVFLEYRAIQVTQASAQPERLATVVLVDILGFLVIRDSLGTLVFLGIQASPE